VLNLMPCQLSFFNILNTSLSLKCSHKQMEIYCFKVNRKKKKALSETT